MTLMPTRLRIPATAVALVVGSTGLVLTTPGCTRPPGISTTRAEREANNPWPAFVAQLRKENDAASSRRLLSQLNNDLAQSPELPHPVGLSADQEKVITGLLNLSEADAKEIRTASYSSLDAAYLSDSLYLRDAAMSMDLTGLPPARQAELAFEWVCRQIVLRPWIAINAQGQPEVMPPAPPTAVLRRGSGSGLERAYVLLALLQQLGLDGTLVGPPDAVGGLWTANKNPQGLPRGPFWAVAIRSGADLLMFDPWRGEPVPGPANKGIATYAQVKAQPDVLKSWFEADSAQWKVSPDEINTSVPFLAVPLSALAPRMIRLEEELKSDLPVRLAMDPVALQKRVSKETGLTDLKFWSPKAESKGGMNLGYFSYLRSLVSFTPAGEGGAPPVEDLPIKYKMSLLPPTLFTTPAELAPRSETDLGVPEVVQRIHARAIDEFGAAFLTPPTPREQIQRGRFFEATPYLVGKRREIDAIMDRIRSDRGLNVAEWAQKARDVYNGLARARGLQRTDPGAFAQAEQEVELFWQTEARTFTALVERAVADAGLAEATYLLAQCKHEQAVQAQARAERLAADPRQKSAAERARQQAADAWGEAKGWWDKYEPFAPTQERAWPGRAAHAKNLAEQAAARYAASQSAR